MSRITVNNNTRQIIVSSTGTRGPAGLNWREEWGEAIGYAVRDAITYGGTSYRCIAAHMSTIENKPGSGPGWESQWAVLAQKGDLTPEFTQAEQNAIAAAERSEGEAGRAQANADQAAAFAGFRDFTNLASLLADSALQYGSETSQVQPGDVVRTRQEGFSYRVADAAASDEHIATAGGVKLYVDFDANGWFPFDAMAPAKDGSTDDLALLNRAIAFVKEQGRNKIWAGSGEIFLSADPANYKDVYIAGDELTVNGTVSPDFAPHDNLRSFNTTPAPAGSTGGSGGNLSWIRTFSGSPFMQVFERTDPSAITWGRLCISHDGFLITADQDHSVIIGVNENQTDEGCFVGLSIKKNQIVFNGAQRDVDVFFYTKDDPQSLFIDGDSGEVRVRGTNGNLSIIGRGTDSRARLWMQNDTRAWSFQVHTTDSWRVSDETGNGAVFILQPGLAGGALTMEAPGTLHLQGLPTQKLRIRDAGFSPSNVPYIECQIGSGTADVCYLTLSRTMPE